MKIDQQRALKILEREALQARAQPIQSPWSNDLASLSSALDEGGGQTIIAVLGTVLLAKATHLEVDVFTLKTKQREPNPFAYSARSLCQHVLAAQAPRLALDLGVTGREPLNNQPFFGKERLDGADLIEKLHPKSRAVYAQFLALVSRVHAITDEPSALEALRAFLFVRYRPRQVIDPSERIVRFATLAALTEHITTLVAQDSEHGKRAQAIVAGLLSASFGGARVLISGVHDPDRHFPGDVALKQPHGDGLSHTFEVRDKPVARTDLDHLTLKAERFGVTYAGIVAIHSAQSVVEGLDEARSWAEARGVRLRLYTSWDAFAQELVFWGDAPLRENIEHIADLILIRLQELEVSEAGLQAWLGASAPR